MPYTPWWRRLSRRLWYWPGYLLFLLWRLRQPAWLRPWLRYALDPQTQADLLRGGGQICRVRGAPGWVLTSAMESPLTPTDEV